MSDQTSIIHDLGVESTFDPAAELARRVGFLKDYLRDSGLRCYVLGISGGVDSTTAAMLAQRAVGELRTEGYEASFAAVRLPYGQQADEADAEAALAAIGPDHLYSINIKPAADAMLAAAKVSGLAFSGAAQEDFILGNIKARQRMIAQYALAGSLGGLVIGTDHAAEAVMGFFTKFGDGAADILPLSGLNKRRVRAIAALLGAPDRLVMKVPTADLENNAPLRPDEDAYGVTYDQIDDFLEGKPINAAAEVRILEAYRKTAHKRALPVAPAWGAP
ncbi:ammonia-dependent NAD(+) synthetase [Devosia sp. BK]|uniref:ammonia-dependent NAD(+) synthetase n=1 Tax=Devosia sp. BK TaxID=2871706 RepID=UPI002939C028|nr:ammonia-dependent NAD(+) synthetase [Devosia sp. BK]MDV3253475.1 ammonia-dependent NAD(+) synthetase [Devosia sp. BK]